MRQLTLNIDNDTILVGNAWETDNSVANVIIFQGMEEYGRRYEGFAKFLNANGFNAYALDCFGQGDNVKNDLDKRSIWPRDGFEKMVEAHHKMVLEAKKNGLKTYIFSHSMGSFMGQLYIEKYPLDVDKIVLCGTGGKNPIIPIAAGIGKICSSGKKRNKKAKLLNSLMFGNFNRGIKEPKTGFDWLSYNTENVNKYIADPLCGFGPTNGFCYEFLKGMNKIYKKEYFSKLDVNQKIFLISGQEDPVTNFGKNTNELRDLYKKQGIKDVTAKVYPNARHEIFFEECNKEVFNDILNFYNS